MSNVRFSQLPTVVALKDSDILAISSPDTSTPPVYTSAQSPISQVAAKIVEDTTFTTSLNTTNKTVAGSINETLSNFANEYSTSSTYAVGDCVLYSGSIYQCTTEIPSGEAWDSTHWTQIKAVDVSSGGGGGVHYSLNEQVIGTWVDGSTLYEKTVYYAGGTTGQIHIPHNITNMSKCVDVFGTCYDIGYKEGSQRIGAGDLPLPRIATDNNNVGFTGVSKTEINVSVGNIWSDRITDFYITLRYTKSST